MVELYSRLKYVIDALEKGWAKGLAGPGLGQGGQKPALNPDLWERLLDLCRVHKSEPPLGQGPRLQPLQQPLR